MSLFTPFLKDANMLPNLSRVTVLLGIIWITTIMIASTGKFSGSGHPRRILVDTDVDSDDVFALFYLLKQNRSEFDLQAITINANGWSDAGHAINHIYDILFMMNRDDIPVGVGGEGGILSNGTILLDVGGYLPVMDQGMLTAGECRYRQAIPVGQRGRLGTNTNYGLRKSFLPQGGRKYDPLRQPTAQQVMRNAISAGPITVFIMGSHTNFAIFLMNNPHLKKNIDHVYVMGGGIGSECFNGTNSSKPEQCGRIGNLYPEDRNPYAEFNIFSDPFAAYTVLHSGIPVTIVPLDATRTVPVSVKFFEEFERRQKTYEARYCFRSLKMIRDTWPGDQFHEAYCMWDSFMAGVAISIMRNSITQRGENEFCEMEYMNLTVVTSNKPYGISDGSNPLFDGLAIPKFNVEKNGVHSGHVQMGMQDPFCLESEQGKCQDGFLKEVTGPEAVRFLVAKQAKPSKEFGSLLEKEFYASFLDDLNSPQQAGRFNISTQYPYYKEVLQKPDFRKKSVGKPVVFDMDMSPGDFLALIYLLKVPVELINLKGILVSTTGWATPATVDVVYDLLHMMGRDDVPIGLGDEFAVGEVNPKYSAIGDCKYAKAIPLGSGGFLDSDTLYGLARDLPRSPRRYTAENSVRYGASRDTDHPELRQPLAADVWKSAVESLEPGSKITILTNGPLTNLAQIINLENTSSVIQDVYIVGGSIDRDNEKGNVFTVPSNEYAEFNMFLDPLAAKAVLESKLDIKLVPLHMQRRVASFQRMLHKLQNTNKTTPESVFSRILLQRLRTLQARHQSYHHVDTFLGEVLGAVVLGGHPSLNQTYKVKPLEIISNEDTSKVGQIIINQEQGRSVKVLEGLNVAAYYDHFAEMLGDQRRSAVIGSFREQVKTWNTPAS